MKRFKTLFLMLAVAAMAFTSCQDEESEMIGTDPNTNSASSETSDLLLRTSARDGSSDDILDGNSCSSIVLPVVAEVNGQEITIVNESQFSLVADIMAQFIGDDDEVTLQFPVTVELSNYTEVVVSSQAELEQLQQACAQADQAEEDLINCLDIAYPMTVLTYDANIEQTGSLSLSSDQELYAFIGDLEDGEDFFSIQYPISLMGEGSSTTTITSDAELMAELNECEAASDAQQELEDELEDRVEDLEEFLANTTFTVESGVDAGVDFTSDFADFTFTFANDTSIEVYNTLTNTLMSNIDATFDIVTNAEGELMIELSFTGANDFEILVDTFTVTDFSNGMLELTSTTNSAFTLVFSAE
ncbi:MAG: hypothetical protein CL868_05045 [Cytophagaceae bacterium]|nr:hypothetical protein [Cytophagaceae bacterium]|tara:strand:- start:5876 stop:6952 length:1077 start_codon:yes stop_codon:yes gene_type:complete